MAGLVTIDAGKEGTINIGSRALDSLYEYMIRCKSTSPVLTADADFDPESDQKGVLGASNCIDFSGLNTGTLEEIYRLLVESVQPGNAFWEDCPDYMDPNFRERVLQQGEDWDAKLRGIRSRHQSAFQEVANLILERLKRM
jgi:hypothetical protein